MFDKQLTQITRKAKSNNKMINLLKMYNANPEYKVMVWYSHIQCHFRYANLIWNENIFNWKTDQMRNLTAKLIISYNGFYKNAMNLDLKTNNE